MRAVLAVVACVACSSRVEDKAGDCLTIPPAVRSKLSADPRGEALYWFEDVHYCDFESNLRSSSTLVRFDMRTRKSHIVLDHVAEPLLFMRGKILVLRPTTRWRAMLVDDTGTVQELTPDYLDVLDVEPIDDHTLAVLADGDGARAVYTLDVDRPRPEYLIDADTLLSTSAGRIYIRQGDNALIVDPKTRTTKPTMLPENPTPNADGAVFVTEKSAVAVQSMSSGMTRTVVQDARDWKLVFQSGSVLVRTPVENRTSFAYLLAAGATRRLPTIVGGTTILATAQLRKQTWALIGHNTANYLGDVVETNAESEVCLLPESGAISFPTRTVPGRFLAVREQFFDAWKRMVPTSSVQIIEAKDAPVTVDIRLTRDVAGSDWARMRERVRELHTKLTAILGDREIRTQLTYADRRVAIERWRRNRLRNRTSVGMGDALISDLAQFDVQVRDLVNEVKGDTIVCSGTLWNLQPRVLENVEVRCSTSRKHTIRIPELAANATHEFSETFQGADEGVLFEVNQAGKTLELVNAADEARAEQVLALATSVYDAAKLALDTHRVDKQLGVDLVASPEFAKASHAEQTAAASTAYKRYEELRAIYRTDPNVKLTLHIYAEIADVSFDFDGTTLRRN